MTELKLPKCVYFKHGAYYLVKRNKWHFLTKDRAKIKEKLERFGFPGGDVPFGAKKTSQKGLKSYVKIAWNRAKANAPSRGKDFTLTLDQAYTLLLQSGGRCTVTNTPFSFDVQTANGKFPYAPSIDRINNSRGYSFENCRIVCVATNLALNDWGDDVFFNLARNAVL